MCLYVVGFNMVVIDVQYIWCDCVDLLVGGGGGLGLDACEGCVLAYVLT